MPDPVLWFTDIDSGPKTGNSDTAFGQIANTDGAYVSIFGSNLGEPGDTVTCTIGGAAALIVARGHATPPLCAANLYNGYQRLYCVIAQVPHLAADGAVAIRVTVNGVADLSPTLTFTVRPGAITFVNSGGNLQAAMDAMAHGDIVYVKDGFTAPNGIGVPAVCATNGTPVAVVAYPGATVTIGNTLNGAFPIVHSGAQHNITYAKLATFGSQALPAMFMGYQTRVVGCTITAPLGNASTGALFGFGSNLYILGNELTACGDPLNYNQLYHVIYTGGQRINDPGNEFVEVNRVYHWNYVHDNTALRAFNNYGGEPGTNPSQGYDIQYNVVVNQVGDAYGLQLGTVGDNTVANNLAINVGLASPGGQDGGGGGVGLFLNMGDPLSYTGPPTPAIIVHAYNNTFINCGTAALSITGVYRISSSAFTADIHNNIFYQATGLKYLSDVINQPPDSNAAHWSNNLYFGAGAAPAGDVGALNVNPLVVSAVNPYNLRLQAGSPAIGTGTAKGTGFDLDGLSRPAIGGWDIGAYQFAAGMSGLIATFGKSIVAQGCPSPEGAHIAAIRAMPDNSWLQLGSPTPDTPWGLPNCASFNASSSGSPVHRGMYIVEGGSHAGILGSNFGPPGNIRDGFVDDAHWFLDINAMRWICIWPGTNVLRTDHPNGFPTYAEITTNGQLVVTAAGRIVDTDGVSVPFSVGGHGWGMCSYDLATDQWVMNYPTNDLSSSGFPDPTGGGQAQYKQPAWDAFHGSHAIDFGHGSPWSYNPVTGRFDQRTLQAGNTGGVNPQSGEDFSLSHFHYVPNLGNFVVVGRNGTWRYEKAAPQFFQVTPTGPGVLYSSADFASCVDRSRSRVYVLDGSLGDTSQPLVNRFFYYDAVPQPGAWFQPFPLNSTDLFLSSASGFIRYDDVNDVLLAFGSWAAGGIRVYHPTTNTWSEDPFTMPSALLNNIVNHVYTANTAWYDPILGVTFIAYGHDSSYGYDIWVYKYRVAQSVPPTPPAPSALRRINRA
jgi:hypothetical protein